MYETIQLEIDGPRAAITLNRPEVRNAFNAQMIAELTEVCTRLHADTDVRVVVLRGNGPTFSGGADINWMRAGLELGEEENRTDARRMSAMFDLMSSLPQPLIGAIHGAALGGGMGLAAVCDIAIAEDGTLFGFTEVKLGIIPAVISTVVMPKIGQSWARALYVTGERFGADIAQRIGLVHWVAPAGRLDDIVESRVAEILAAGPNAARAAKRLALWFEGVDRDEAQEFTAQQIAAIRASPEGQEGLRAFLDKRKPHWRSNDG